MSTSAGKHSSERHLTRKTGRLGTLQSIFMMGYIAHLLGASGQSAVEQARRMEFERNQFHTRGIIYIRGKPYKLSGLTQGWARAMDNVKTAEANLAAAKQRAKESGNFGDEVMAEERYKTAKDAFDKIVKQMDRERKTPFSNLMNLTPSPPQKETANFNINVNSSGSALVPSSYSIRSPANYPFRISSDMFIPTSSTMPNFSMWNTKTPIRRTNLNQRFPGTKGPVKYKNHTMRHARGNQHRTPKMSKRHTGAVKKHGFKGR